MDLSCRNQLEKLKIVTESSKSYLADYFSDLRNQIDICFFEKKLKNDSHLLHDNWKSLINRTHLFEISLKKIELDENQIKETKQNIEIIEKKIDSFKNLAMELESENESDSEEDEDGEIKLYLEITDLINEEIIKLERILFMNKTIIFLESQKFKSNLMNTFKDEFGNHKCLIDKLDIDSSFGKLLIVNNQYLGKQAIDILLE